jgi:single-strand DNA-binding protein
MYNKDLKMGRLTKSPELKTTNNGKSVCTFSIAVNRDYQKDKTDFFNCVAWGQTAEFIARYFEKGSMIFVDGRLENREYEKDGQKRTVTEITVEKASFCGDKKEQAKTVYDNPQPKAETKTDIGIVLDDSEIDGELPF